MNFKTFKEEMQVSFAEMTKNATHLFEVEVDKDEMWQLYLDSFPEGTNEVYRERREYDCSCCRSFVKNIGNAVVIENGNVISVWDFETSEKGFQPVIDALSVFIKAKAVTNIYVSKLNKIGTDRNFEQKSDGTVDTWEHFYLELPSKFVDKSIRSEGDIKGGFRDIRNVFKRSLDELTQDSVQTVMELIASNTLYKGDEWKQPLTLFLQHKKAYDKLKNEKQKGVYTWEQSVKVGAVIGKIRNHSIGTLLINISEGMDLNLAVRKYEAIVAPSNYKRPKAIFTQKMLEDAKKTIQELGYMDSLERRYAKLDDITVNNILFSNRDSAKRIAGSVFDEMSMEVSAKTKKFSKIEEIGIDDFISGVLPSAQEVEVLLENKHTNSMVSLIAPQKSDSKTMFKWDNNFSWAYSGNMTDSNIRENVKSAGGKVDGDLRFSIQWNDLEPNRNDLDAHCITPDGDMIYFRNKINHRTGGNLDVDIISPKSGVPAVENITFPTRSRMVDGVYKFYVNVFSHNGGRDGFRAEIEFDGQVFSFDCGNDIRGKTAVAEVTLENGVFTIKEKLTSSVSSKEVWGLKTNQFVPVSVVMYSPNYWNEQNGIGHKHCMFMLKDCVNTEQPNGFYNEFLKEDLMAHKRVFEALGGKMKVEDVEDQLSGVGFSMTKRGEVTVKVKGKTERIMKVKF